LGVARLILSPPGAVGQRDGFDFLGERAVPADRHRGPALGVPRRLAGVGFAGGFGDGSSGPECVGELLDGWENLVTVIAPGNEKGRLNGGDRRIANTRDGKPV
jgi:hypothetical protein